MNASAGAAALLIALALSPGTGHDGRVPVDDAPTALSMRFQQTARTRDGLALRFVGYDDRRCPADVACIRQGEARAYFWLEGAGIEAQVLSLPLHGTGGGPPPPAVAARHSFVLRSLTPVQKMRDPAPPGDYTAVIEVRRTATALDSLP